MKLTSCKMNLDKCICIINKRERSRKDRSCVTSASSTLSLAVEDHSASSQLSTEMGDLEPKTSLEDAAKRMLWFEPMTSLVAVLPLYRDES